MFPDDGISSIPFTSGLLEKIFEPTGIMEPSKVPRYTCLSVLRNIVPIGVNCIVIDARHQSMGEITSSLASREAGVKSLAESNHMESALAITHRVAKPVSVFKP